ncbi:MAG TPA: riboflavin synthase [Clostridium sp.]|nr:riboflavin synthase [Clostridium sp.]
MFTGIVEELGKVEKIQYDRGFYKIDIQCQKVLEGTKLGDSICVNGVCLTVNKLYENHFIADVMGETMARTNLGVLTGGDKVNLERALSLSDRLGGHVVTGHVDGKGRIVDIDKKIDGTWLSVQASEDILKYIILKGSITINGISLTVAYVDENIFKVSVIPHTLENTILNYRKVNDFVNIECDLIGKYVEKLLLRQDDIKICNKESNITMEFLSEHGF